MAITEKTRQADEKLREELRHADIGKLKKLMAPLIEKSDEKSKPQRRITDKKGRKSK